MEAEKQHEAEEGEERGLAHGEADDGWGKAECEPMDISLTNSEFN